MRTVNPGERVSSARAHPSDASEPAALVHRVQIRCAGPAHLEWLRALAPKLIALRHQYAEVVLEAQLDGPESCSLVCERLDGETLAEVLRREVRLPLVEARAICRQIAEALGEAHARGIAHGNLCPDNVVFVRPRGRDGSPQIRVRGFGMGPPLGDGLFGTPRYLAPEQVRLQDPRPAATPLSDQFALAVLFSEILSGQPVFLGSSLEALRPLLVRQDRRHFESPDTTLKEQRRVNRALERALQKAPESRFATPLEFVAELEPRARASSVFGSSMVVPRRPALDAGAGDATLRIARIEPRSPTAAELASPPTLVRAPRVTAAWVQHRAQPPRWFAAIPRAVRVRVLVVVLVLACAPWSLVLRSTRSDVPVHEDARRPVEAPRAETARPVHPDAQMPRHPSAQPIVVTPLPQPQPAPAVVKKSEPLRRSPPERKVLRRPPSPGPVAASIRCAPRGFSSAVTILLTACADKLGAGPARFDLTLFPDGRDRLIYKLNESSPHGADALLRCLSGLRSPSLGSLPPRGTQWFCK